MLHLTRKPDVPLVTDLTSYEESARETLGRGFPLMYFPKQLEDLFEHETEGGRRRQLVLVGLVWIGISLLYAFFFPLHPDPDGALLSVDQIVRLVVATPVIVAATFAAWWGVRPFVRELMMMVACVVAPSSIIMLIVLTQGGEAGIIRGAITVVLLFITVVVRLRFWFSVATCLSLIFMQVAIPYLLDEQVPGYVPLVLATIFVSLIASYSLEREFRLNYLQRIIGRIQGARLASMVDQLHDLSQRDALTGLLNRRALDTLLKERCAKMEPFSVILVDVDGFKAFNDLYGHQEGDDCLRRIAAMLRASLRFTSDRVARMGGEEFAVVLPRTKLGDACSMAERMRKSILELRIPHSGSPTGSIVSISIGVAEARIPTTPEEVVAEADKALYLAKSEGRNRVAVLGRKIALAV